LRSNTEGYGGKTHYTGSQNSDTTAPSGRELYHFQFSLQATSPETFGYTFVLRVGGRIWFLSELVRCDSYINEAQIELHKISQKATHFCHV
jgi:hypothetical protein